MTRELRLNNPMGIKYSSDKFQGEVRPSSDAVFKQFITEVEGIRAGAKILLTYFNLYSLNTVAQIIARWAPGNENDTEAYIADVVQRTGFYENQIVNLIDSNVLKKLVAAIIYHENGQEADNLIISDAVMLAYA